MRLLRLDLIAFGPFTETVLDFGTTADRPGMHLVYGANEAGKSSTLRALRAALFGFPHQTGDDFFHNYQKLRVGATLESADDVTLSFIRRKGKKNTLLAEDGQSPLPDDALFPFLKNVREDEFFSMFAIGHAELRVGGREVLQGHGKLGELIFMATAGLPRLRRVEQSLAEEAGRLFLPRGTSRSINETLTRIADLRKAQKEKFLRPEEFTRRTADLKQARDDRAAVETERETRRRDKARLDRIAQALPTAARLRQHRAEIERLGDVPRLPDGFASNREELQRESRSLAGRMEQLQDDLAATEKELDRLSVPDELLAVASDIERLYGQVTVHEKAIRDAHQLQIEANQLETEAATLLRSIRPELMFSEVESLRLTRPELATIRALSVDRRALENALREHDGKTRQLAARISQASMELDELGHVVPLERPREILRRATREGDLDAALAAAANEAAMLSRRIDAGRLALPFWSGPPQEISALPIPSAATVDRFEAEFTAVDRELALLHQQKADLEQQLREAEQLQQREDCDGDVPSLDALRESRRLRDTGWREIRRDLEGHRPGPDRESFLGDTSLSLPDAYELAVERSDSIADRLRNEAERVERFARLQQQAERARSDIAALSNAESTIGGRREKLAADWVGQWPFLSDLPATPREMRDWSLRHAELTRLVEQHRDAAERAEVLRERISSLRNELSDAFAERSLAVPEGASLRSCVDEAERTIGMLDAKVNQHRTLTTERLRSIQERQELDVEAAANRDALDRVQQEWTIWMRRLGLPETSGHDAALAVLDTLADLFERIDRIAPQQQRIAAIRDEANRYAKDVRALAERFDSELAAQPFGTAMRALNASLVEACSLRNSRIELSKRLEKLKRDLVEGSRQATTIEASLQELCRQARCDDPADLPAVEQRAAERRRGEAQVEQAEAELSQRSGGRSVAEFLAEIESVDSDAIELELERTATRLEELEHRRDDLVQVITTLEQELSRMKGGADAATAAEDTEVAIARLTVDIEQYARLKFASKLLRDGRERFQRKSGNAVLDRAGELFAVLTDNHFSRLAVDYSENDEPRLVGVRASGANVPVDGMSDGTADQLYLALRLAGLSAWLDNHEPLPLVVDDILVHFDDARSTAALRALAALSQRTQIILFTHHEHIVDLARRAVDSGTLHIHALDTTRKVELDDRSTKSKLALF